MVKEKVSFKEFQSAVAPEHQAFVDKLNNKRKAVTLLHTSWRKRL